MLGVSRADCNNWGGVLTDPIATEEMPMEFIVWVETRLAGKTLAVEEVAKFDRCASGCRISCEWTHLISSEWDHPISG
jgi:hypothetical protein